MSNIFLKSWSKVESCLRHSTYIHCFYHRIKTRCYKMLRAYCSSFNIGNGIPKNIVDKIFQPFFTTNPTGRGTRLMQRLSYEIVNAEIEL